MEFVKLSYIDDNSNECALFVNPAHVESISGMEMNTRLGLISGGQFTINGSPYDIAEKLGWNFNRV